MSINLKLPELNIGRRGLAAVQEFAPPRLFAFRDRKPATRIPFACRAVPLDRTDDPSPAARLPRRLGRRWRAWVRTASLAAGVALGFAGVANAAQPLQPVAYTAIDGHVETLVPWQGQNVSVLVEPGPTRNAAVMSKMVSALDAAFSYYATTTGRLPAIAHSLNGRDEIAEVSSTCGAGCTYIGATGTEILTSYFENMYQQIASNDQFDQTPFYELGRSFWFWSPQLQFQAPDPDPVVTGYAVLMRFASMAKAGVNGAPFNGTPFPTFASQVAALAGQYEAHPSLSFAQTLAQAKSPGLYGGTDFWASLMMQLAARHGGQTFLHRFFTDLGTLPAASSTAAAVTNWLTAANYAACTGLSPVFYTRWGFPHPDGTVTTRPPASSVPEPTGTCPGATPPTPPRNTTPPTITGTPTTGQTLTEINGSWTNPATGFNFPTGYHYQWEDCNNSGNHCTTIPHATNNTYTLTPRDTAHTIRIQERQTNPAGTSKPATTTPTQIVRP
jgi:hypothetical protein